MKFAQKETNQALKSNLFPQMDNVQKLSSRQTQKEQSNKENHFQFLNDPKKQNSNRKCHYKISPENKYKLLSNDHSEVLYFSNQIRKICISKYDVEKEQDVPYNVTRIMTSGKISAASDNLGNLWLLGAIFPYPINLSQVIRKKIIDAFLGEKWIVLKCNESFYVVNWDKTNPPMENVSKIEIEKKFGEFFECWQEVAPYQADAWYLFGLKKDSFVQTAYYQIFSQYVVIFPKLQEIKIGNKIKGLSVSKTHALCWTECGKIYSWGQNCLALGYTQFQQNMKQRQIQNIRFQVVFAIAGTHYSIALSVEGQLYQWGVKSFWSVKTNSLTEQFIFIPRRLDIKFNQESQKISCLKGNEDHFGVISLRGFLYVWGKRIPKKLIQFDGVYEAQSYIIQPHSQNVIQPTRNLLYPTLCRCSRKVKIIDFQMRQDYVFLVTAHKMTKIKNKLCQKFWSQRVKNITSKIQNSRISRKSTYQFDTFMSTEEDQIGQIATKQIDNRSLYFNTKRHRKYQSALQFQSQGTKQKGQKMQKDGGKSHGKFVECNDRITKAINQRLSKQEYFKGIHDQQRMLKNIMQNDSKMSLVKRSVKMVPSSYMASKNDRTNYVKLQRVVRKKTSILRHSEGSYDDRVKLKVGNNRNKYQSINDTVASKMIPTDRSKVKYLPKNSPIQLQKIRRSKLYESSKKKQHVFQTSMNSPAKENSQLYKLKLNQVLSRKQFIIQDFFKSTIQKIQKTSTQYRKKQAQATEARKQKQQKHTLLKKTIFQYLVKAYILKCLTNPILQGRQIKIKIFVANLKHNRIEKSMKKLFMTTRIKFDAQILRQYMPRSYLKLVVFFRNFAKKWKQDRRKYLIKFCVNKVMRINVQNKLKAGLHNVKVNIKNLQRIGKWLQIIKEQKMNCLNTIWKRQLIGILKVQPQHQYQYNALNLKSQTKNFKQLYMQRVKKNSMLKIKNYLRVFPLFKVKMSKICQQDLIHPLQKHQQQLQIGILTPKHIQMTNQIGFKDKVVIKQDQQQKFDLRHSVLSQNSVLLPYSKHSNVFIKPMNLEMNMNESVKESQRWAQQEKKILAKTLANIIKCNQFQYGRRMHKYQRQMAIFIRDNYSQISQRRWKYIIEFNKLKKRDEKKVHQKQNQLRKLLRTVRSESILESDILPQKHKILDQAKQMKGAPQFPQQWVTFGPNEFREAFKQYFQALQNKNKSLKRARNNYLP